MLNSPRPTCRSWQGRLKRVQNLRWAMLKQPRDWWILGVFCLAPCDLLDADKAVMAVEPRGSENARTRASSGLDAPPSSRVVGCRAGVSGFLSWRSVEPSFHVFFCFHLSEKKGNCRINDQKEG